MSSSTPAQPAEPGAPKTGAAKPTPPTGSRRDRLASLETERKKEARRRSMILLVVCVVLAAGVLAYPVYLFASDAAQRAKTIGDLGVSMAAASCDPIVSNPATGNQNHVAEGTKVNYDRLPPDSGPHYPSPAAITKKFYTVADRPEVETIVHNLEHGYTVVWYRADLGGDQLAALEGIAKTFGGQTQEDKFIAAPWSESDGGPFPAGKNVVLTRWTADPQNPADTAKQLGVRESCGAVSGEAVKDFMTKYPYTSSPEPNGA
ncbi:MAG: DUF3105 domain-containing protein [Propionibacteriaceae bacterium]